MRLLMVFLFQIFTIVYLGFCHFFHFAFSKLKPSSHPHQTYRVNIKAKPFHRRRKPDWIRNIILQLKIQYPHAGYTTLAQTFNLQYPNFHVSRSFVGNVIRAHRLQLARLQHSKRKPRRESPLAVWGIDMTGLPLANGNSIPVFGIIDHSTRVSLHLKPNPRHNSLILLGQILQTMGKFGIPKAVRSDNDAVFKTFLFKTTLKLLGVRQQFTDLGSPWQNGRIERFWRTLKQALLQKRTILKDGLFPIKTKFKFASVDAMQTTLTDFQNHYNHARPHQSLNGITPAMAWQKPRSQ